jgi:hypothetical protein
VPTPLTKLRKGAPGSLTLDDVAAFFRRKRYPRHLATISAFEHGRFATTETRFLDLYAQAIGCPVAEVERALKATRRKKA